MTMRQQWKRLRFWLRESCAFLRRTKEEDFLQSANDILLEYKRTENPDVLRAYDAELQNDLDEYTRMEPTLCPRRTLLFGGGYYSRKCNFLTASRYRKHIRHTYTWAVEHKIDTFIVDYTTPIGLLALETLLSLRDAGESFHLYAVRSISVRERKSYRLIRETPIEIIFLQLNCDYTYRSPNFIDMKEKVYSKVGVLCNTKGIRIMRENLGTAAADFL